MSLGKRKIMVAIWITVVLVIANVWGIASWLDKAGVVDFARYMRREYLTGTAITISVVLLLLLLPPAGQLINRCRMCQRMLFGPAKYCGRCGCRV
ncbi:MAG: hypothetical protein NTU53_14255 [Planctomycetota bacterium]|nr:hypothetical protein [Planctomycetota bacterium]